MIETLTKIKEVYAQKPVEFSDDDISNLVIKLGEMKKFISNLEDELKARCRKNGHCGRHKLIKTDGAREVKDILCAFRALVPVLSADTFLGACKVSILKLEEAYHKHLNKNKNIAEDAYTKEKAVEMLSETLGDNLGRGTPKEKLVLLG